MVPAGGGRSRSGRDERSSVGFRPGIGSAGSGTVSHGTERRFDIVRINEGNVDVLDVVADEAFDDEMNDELLQAVLDNGQLLLTAIFTVRLWGSCKQ